MIHIIQGLTHHISGQLLGVNEQRPQVDQLAPFESRDRLPQERIQEPLYEAPACGRSTDGLDAAHHDEFLYRKRRR